MTKRIFNTPFSRSAIPWDDWKHLIETKYDFEKEITIFPGKAGRTEDGPLSKGFVVSRQLKPRPKGVRGSATGAWERRMWDILNFDGNVSVRCCNQLHTLRLEKDLSLTALEHDDLDGLRMMQTFGDDGSLRCLEIVDAWNQLVTPDCTNVLHSSWEIKELRQKLPKILVAVYDHFRSVFSFHQAEHNLTSRRKRYSHYIEPKLPSIHSRIKVRARKIVQDYASKAECWYMTYAMADSDNLRWFKNVKSRGLDKVYSESDWLKFVDSKDRVEKGGLITPDLLLPWPVLNATENRGDYIVMSPDVSKVRPENHRSQSWTDLYFYTVEKRTCGYLGNIFVIPDTALYTNGGE